MELEQLRKILKEYRKKKGLTQKQLGEIVGVSTSTIAKYENGDLEPNLKVLSKLAKALDINMNDLFFSENFIETFEKYVDMASSHAVDDILPLINYINNYRFDNKYDIDKISSDDLMDITSLVDSLIENRIVTHLKIKKSTYEESKTFQDLKPTVLAAHDDNLTDDEKAEADRRILEAINKLKHEDDKK